MNQFGSNASSPADLTKENAPQGAI